MLEDLCLASGMRYLILRYFNVAGSDPDGRIGQSTKNSTLLIKVAVEAAVGKRDVLRIFGTDYESTDGTGVRDYIHVTDIAAAHVDGLTYLEENGESVVLNCGYGHGYSVREVLDEVNAQIETPIKIVEADRRAGDPGILIAEAQRIRETLGWHPHHDDLSEIVRTSLAWERHLAEKTE